MTITGSACDGPVAWSESELVEEFVGASSNGGQHANRNATTVRLTHSPTGIVVVAAGRSQWRNRQDARTQLTERLDSAAVDRMAADRAAGRAEAITPTDTAFRWVAWRDQVTGPGGRRASMTAALRGRLDPLFAD